MRACCRDQYREESSDALERMKPEDVYDSIRRTTADIRHYVKMESNTASPPSARTGCVASQRRDTSDNGVAGSSAASYRLPVVRSPDGRTRQRYNQVITFCASCRRHELVSWSLTSLFSTNMAISEMNRRHEMYIGHSCLCVCLSVPRRIPTLLHGPGCYLGEW